MVHSAKTGNHLFEFGFDRFKVVSTLKQLSKGRALRRGGLASNPRGGEICMVRIVRSQYLWGPVIINAGHPMSSNCQSTPVKQSAQAARMGCKMDVTNNSHTGSGLFLTSIFLRLRPAKMHSFAHRNPRGICDRVIDPAQPDVDAVGYGRPQRCVRRSLSDDGNWQAIC